MRKIYIDNVKGNELLAKSIYDSQGRILLAEGMTLRLNYISKLKEMGIVSLYIEDQFSKGIQEENFLSYSVRERSKQQFKMMLDKIKETQQFDITEVNHIVDQIMDEILYKKEVLIHVADILSYDEYTYSHSVNVCTLAIIMCKVLGYSVPRIKEVAIGALLHDLGKIFVPEEILNKKGPLTSEEFQKMKLHPQDGYQVLRGYSEMSAISKIIVLAHHERLDGSGYPSQLSGDKIHEVVRLVSICDVFDAMTSDRVYRKGIKTYEVIEYLISMSGQAFDVDIVQEFIKHIAVYPVGRGIILNTGEKGIVVKQNPHMPSRPVLRIFWNEKGEEITPYEIDMTKEITLFIVDEVDI